MISTNGYDAGYAAINGSNGTSGISGTTPTRGERARSMEHQQVGAWSVAPVEDPGARTGVIGAALQHNGSAVPGRAVESLHRTAGYVIRLSGGVGGGYREVSPYPESAS